MKKLRLMLLVFSMVILKCLVSMIIKSSLMLNNSIKTRLSRTLYSLRTTPSIRSFLLLAAICQILNLKFQKYIKTVKSIRSLSLFRPKKKNMEISMMASSVLQLVLLTTSLSALLTILQNKLQKKLFSSGS